MSKLKSCITLLIVLGITIVSVAQVSLEERVAILREKADKGDPDAQVRLGVAYEDGNGVLQNNAQAAVWYRKSAEPGYAGGQLLLGIAYEDGKGVPKDDVQAAGQAGGGSKLYLGLRPASQDLPVRRSWEVGLIDPEREGPGLGAMRYLQKALRDT
jgi:hypothetical protein